MIARRESTRYQHPIFYAADEFIHESANCDPQYRALKSSARTAGNGYPSRDMRNVSAVF